MFKKLQKAAFFILFCMNFTQFSTIFTMKRPSDKKSFCSRLLNCMRPSKQRKITDEKTAKETQIKNFVSPDTSSINPAIQHENSSNDDDSCSATSSTTGPIKILSLKQNDGWSCGYYAAFNTFIIKNAIKDKTEKELPETLGKLKPYELNEQFESFFEKYKKLSKDSPDSPFAKLNPDDIKRLNISQLKALLQDLLQFNYTDTDISIIGDQGWDFALTLIGLPLFRSIQNFRKNNTPQIIILAKDGHWTTHVFTKQQIWSIDSLNPIKSSSISNFIQKLHEYFLYKKLPETETELQQTISAQNQIANANPIDLTL